MKNFRLLIATVVASFLIAPLFAQSSRQNREDQTMQVYYYSPSQPMNIAIIDFITMTPERHYLEPTAPRFLLTDSKHKFALGIGGVVRATTSVDFAGIIPNSYDNGFITALIPTSRGSLPMSQAMMSAATSEIFLKMVGTTRHLGNFSVYVSMNFMGENYAPQLRNAYIDFMGFRAGQTWSTFTDLNSIPPTIDYNGPISYTGYYVPQLRYTRLFARERMQFAVAAEYPTVYATYPTMDVEQPQGVPNFVGYLQANFGDGGHIRASGLYRSMNYKDTDQEMTDRKNGWGVQLSGLNSIGRAVTFYYQGVYGEGISRYMNDMSNMSFDMVPNTNDMGAMVTPRTWGAYGGLKIDISDSVYCSGTYSYSRIYTQKDIDMDDMYKYAQYYVGNIFWKTSNECTLGVEYLRGNKTDFDGGWGKANRVNLLVQYNF